MTTPETLYSYGHKAAHEAVGGLDDVLVAWGQWSSPYTYVIPENHNLFPPWDLPNILNPSGWRITSHDAAMQSAWPPASGYDYSSNEMLWLPAGRYTASCYGGFANAADIATTSEVYMALDFAVDVTNPPLSALLATWPFASFGAVGSYATGLVRSAFKGAAGRFGSVASWIQDVEAPVAMQVGVADTTAAQSMNLNYLAVTVIRL